MKLEETIIPDLKIIKPKINGDNSINQIDTDK